MRGRGTLAALGSRGFFLAVLFAASACGGAGDNGGCPDGAPSWCQRSDASADADIADGDYVPFVAGEYDRVYIPRGIRYLNDHTIVRGADGQWHVYGITSDTTGMPFQEQSFLHATAPDLLGPWTDQPDILAVDPALNESVMWAPYAFERAPGQWTMYYAAGWGASETLMRTLRRADSTDLVHWTRAETTSTESLRPPGGRDPMVLRDHGRWLLYSVGVDAQAHGQILVSTNDDLDHPEGWTQPAVALTDPVPNFGWGNLESPFVVPYGGSYYLFTTRTSSDSADYVRTVVFRSRDPMNFAWDPVADLRAHAAEIVTVDDRYYITSGGWTANVGEENRGLLIAPLTWARLQ